VITAKRGDNGRNGGVNDFWGRLNCYSSWAPITHATPLRRSWKSLSAVVSTFKSVRSVRFCQTAGPGSSTRKRLQTDFQTVQPIAYGPFLKRAEPSLAEKYFQQRPKTAIYITSFTCRAYIDQVACYQRAETASLHCRVGHSFIQNCFARFIPLNY